MKRTACREHSQQCIAAALPQLLQGQTLTGNHHPHRQRRHITKSWGGGGSDVHTSISIALSLSLSLSQYTTMCFPADSSPVSQSAASPSALFFFSLFSKTRELKRVAACKRSFAAVALIGLEGKIRGLLGLTTLPCRKEEVGHMPPPLGARLRSPVACAWRLSFTRRGPSCPSATARCGGRTAQSRSPGRSACWRHGRRGGPRPQSGRTRRSRRPQRGQSHRRLR